MLMRFWYLVSVFFGSGKSPKAPGTMGSLASLLIWIPIVMWETSLVFRLIAIILIFVLGTFAIYQSKSLYADVNSDPKEIVIDEVCGQGIALLLCPPNLWYIMAGFVFFRIFDILKPWPIGLIDRNIKGPLGIMLDDILAGVFAAIVLMLVLPIVL